jgi:hypothetical protein
MPLCRIPQNSDAALLGHSLSADESAQSRGRPKVVVGGASLVFAVRSKMRTSPPNRCLQ